jgi:hypothetical protein
LIELKGFLVVYYVLRERGEREKEGKRTVERVKTIFLQGYIATPLNSFGFLITPRILENVIVSK